MSIFQTKFTTGQVLAASGVTNPSLQTWIARGVVVGDKPGAPGIKRTFTFFDVMAICVAKALIDVGMPLHDAFAAAKSFAHTGDREGASERVPSFPWPGEVRSVLCVAGPRSVVLPWTSKTDIYTLARHHLARPQGFVALDINDVFERVVRELGYDSGAVRREAYPTGAS